MEPERAWNLECRGLEAEAPQLFYDERSSRLSFPSNCALVTFSLRATFPQRAAAACRARDPTRVPAPGKMSFPASTDRRRDVTSAQTNDVWFTPLNRDVTSAQTSDVSFTPLNRDVTSAQSSDFWFSPLNGDARRVTLLEEMPGPPHTSLLGRPEERKCDEDEEFHKVNKRINDPPVPGSPGSGSSSHALSRDVAALRALSSLHPVEANQGPPPCNRTLFPNTSTPPGASSEHLASAFWNWVNTGIADPGVTSPAAEQIEAHLSSGSAATISDLTEQFGRMFGSPCARMNLTPMFGGDQDGSSAEIEQQGTKLASMCAMKGRTHADSRSTNLTDSDMSDFSSGSEAFGDLMPGLHVSRSLYFPARDSPLTASSRDPWTRQMRAARTSQVREGVESSKFDQGSCSRGGKNPLERVWYPRQPSPPPPQPAEPSSIHNQAEPHQAPTLMNESTWKWSGKLPRIIHTNPVFSTKVFLGGTQGSITEANLLGSFSAFGNVTVEWPKKNSKFRWDIPKGHVYLLFESEEGVRALLRACKRFDEDDHHALYLYMMSMVSHNHESSHVVEVIPWVVADSSIGLDPRECWETGLDVFVGALHGLITAQGLANVLNDLFGGVVYVRIGIDKHRYPIGSARVKFGNRVSYMKAVAAEFVEIQTPKFRRKECFQYYCKSCWCAQHAVEDRCFHRQVIRY